MEKEDLKFDQSLQKLNILFVLSGMNLKYKIKTTSDRIKHTWLFILNFLCLVLVLSLASTYVVVGIANKKNIIEVTSLLPCMTITVVAIFKSFSHLFKERKISDLIEAIRDLDRDENQREASVERITIVNKDQTFLNRVINILYITICIMMLVFNTVPLIMMAVMYYKTNEYVMILQYLDIFAYTPYEMKYWILAYIHQFWAEYVVLVEVGAADYLLFTCCLYIRTQFRLLQYDIETLIPEFDELMSENELQRKLSELVIRHQKIIASTEILEAIYTSSNLVNFLSSSLVICLTGFTLAVSSYLVFFSTVFLTLQVVRDVVVVVKYITFFIMGLAQVFFSCWFADMMTSASTDISNAVYKSRWYRCQVSGSKTLLLMQTRAQRPCALTTAGFADVNLRAFLRVLSSSWSYFALLQTMFSSSEKYE